MKLYQRAWSTQRAVYRAMSSPDVFRSSPARRASQVVHVIGSSSPAFPEISELIDRAKSSKPPLKSGSKSNPIPDDAPSGFTTARDLWQAREATHSPNGPFASDGVEAIDPEADEASVCIVEEPKANVKTRSEGCTARPRKSRTKKTSPVQEVEPPTTPSRDQPWRKFKPSPRGQMSSPEGFTIGADAPPSAQLPPEEHRLLETEVISRHFRPKRNVTVEAQETNTGSTSISKAEDASLMMDPAPIRRLDWTPPPPESRQLDQDGPSTLTSHPGTSSQQASPRVNEDAFKSLLESYECPESVAHIPRESCNTEGGLGKRKLVEPVNVRAGSAPDKSRSVSPAKQKAPKKRPRTITELATAAYRVQEEELPPPAPSLLEYMTSTTEADKAETSSTKPKAKPRKRQTKTSKKKADPPKPILLSPAAALKHVANQDFVFGTSSQLAQEKSPTFLRNLHAAMQQSNEAKDPDFGILLNSDGIEPPERRPRLWDAAARNADGDLFDMKVIDLADESPTLPAIVEHTDPFGYVRTEGAAAPDSPLPAPVVITSDDSFMSLSDLLPAKSKKNASDRQTPDPTLDTITKDHIAAEFCPEERGLASLEQASQPHAGGAVSVEADEVQVANSLSYEVYTDTQLAEQVANRGLRPVKRRATMIALLQKSSKTVDRPKTLNSPPNSRTLSTTAAASAASPSRPRGRPKKTTTNQPSTADPTSAVQTSSPSKRTRGRPRKDEVSPNKATSGRAKAKKKDISPKAKGKAKASAGASGKSKAKPKAPVLEIADSASDDGGDLSRSPSPSPDPTFSPSAGTEPSISAGDDTDLSMNIAPTDQQATLFRHITKIVTTTPRSTDADHPNWYEKMLLYDPIVVEDLAAWLNDGQLNAAGCESQVTPAEVKKWCESKSVCCVWSDSNRGKARKRY